MHKKRRSAASSGKAGGGVQYHRGGVSALRRGVDPGHECSVWLGSTQTSVQWLFSVTSLLPYTVGQMEWVMLVANFLIFFAEVAFVLMASVWAKNNLTALSVALISVVAPLIVYMVVPGSLENGCPP